MGTAQLSPMGESGRKTLLRQVELSASWSPVALKQSVVVKSAPKVMPQLALNLFSHTVPVDILKSFGQTRDRFDLFLSYLACLNLVLGPNKTGIGPE
jgi:hypothetical protein